MPCGDDNVPVNILLSKANPLMKNQNISVITPLKRASFDIPQNRQVTRFFKINKCNTDLRDSNIPSKKLIIPSNIPVCRFASILDNRVFTDLYSCIFHAG